MTAPSCPIARAVAVVGDRWSFLIMRNALLGTTRFDGFRSGLGIADNILSNRLSRLVEAGLLVRVPYRDGGRTRHEYRLTEAGADLLPVLNAVATWGARHTEDPHPDRPMRILHGVCGTEITSGAYCPACGRDVPNGEVRWVRPWLGAEPTALAGAMEA